MRLENDRRSLFSKSTLVPGGPSRARNAREYAQHRRSWQCARSLRRGPEATGSRPRRRPGRAASTAHQSRQQVPGRMRPGTCWRLWCAVEAARPGRRRGREPVASGPRRRDRAHCHDLRCCAYSRAFLARDGPPGTRVDLENRLRRSFSRRMTSDDGPRRSVRPTGPPARPAGGGFFEPEVGQMLYSLSRAATRAAKSFKNDRDGHFRGA